MNLIRKKQQQLISIQLNRTIAVDEPRVTTFPIVWDEQQSTDQLVFAELTEEEKKLAEINEELEICQSLENVNCTNETTTESTKTPSIEPKTTDEPIVSSNGMD